MDYILMAGDVRDFLHGQGLGNAFILGHSMGGKTAMQLALSYPDMVRKLIVADMSPRRDFGRHERIIAGMRSLELTRFQTRKEIEEALGPVVPDLATCQFLLKNVARGPTGGFYWRIGLEEIQTNYARLTEPIAVGVPFTGATLFLRGETSDYLLEDDLTLILPLFPRAVIQTIPASGHLIHIDNPVVFLKSVVAFLVATS
jgi:esterase